MTDLYRRLLGCGTEVELNLRLNGGLAHQPDHEINK
jgi:hypothetical protein